jgi:6-phosphogluconolactonase/glucosamine-6-phosphate isomerase/deaminase
MMKACIKLSSDHDKKIHLLESLFVQKLTQSANMPSSTVINLLFLLTSFHETRSFTPILPPHSRTSLNLAPASKVHILPTENDVTPAVHSVISSAAQSAISTRGHFALAIPGGSVLKVLSSLDPSWDVDKMTLAFVNHKCVPVHDVKTAIEAQARGKFLDRWGVTDNVISLGGTSDGEKEASEYETKLKSLPESVLPRDAEGFPVFDLALIGVGDNGHIGSLYPHRSEIDVVGGPWVVPARRKTGFATLQTMKTRLSSVEKTVEDASRMLDWSNARRKSFCNTANKLNNQVQVIPDNHVELSG